MSQASRKLRNGGELLPGYTAYRRRYCSVLKFLFVLTNDLVWTQPSESGESVARLQGVTSFGNAKWWTQIGRWQFVSGRQSLNHGDWRAKLMAWLHESCPRTLPCNSSLCRVWVAINCLLHYYLTSCRRLLLGKRIIAQIYKQPPSQEPTACLYLSQMNPVNCRF
jgi:hypothetical protein